MATRTATTGDLTVTTNTPLEQANLLIQIFNGRMGEATTEAMTLLSGYGKPPTYEQFVKDHPRGSNGYRAVQGLLGTGETIATFVKRGILDQELVFDLLWVSGSWSRVKEIALHERREAGNDAIYENYEWLANRQA